MPGPAFAMGDTVSLHPVEEEDYEFIQRGRNEPSTRVPLTDTTIRSRSDVEEMFDDDTEYHFLVCADGDKEEPEPVGVVAFPWVSDGDSGSLMYWIASEHRREGYVSEAVELVLDYVFRECGFHKVTARVLVTNDASIQTLESIGFEREGHFREDNFYDGEWVDAYQYSLLSHEWLN
ncbi:GNAT family N-acetyltransferase [Halostella pelagica]|uniref:GNAT family N-acetyltransferase n=1 Tax=Halostella pelagica TaxID=2583824 RepID=UPI001080C78B|nr:GNAT family protein [Halostella pelagica]